MAERYINKNLHIVPGNTKLKSTDEVMFLTWSLMSRITCPYSTATCRRKCYARDNENFSSVRKSRISNYNESLKETFVSDMTILIERYLCSKKASDKIIFFRIHVSGDFYDEEYLNKWIHIANSFKGRNIVFQSYTKCVKYLVNIKDLLGVNIRFVFSQWWDTPESDIDIANDLKLPTFIACTPLEVLYYINKGAFECTWDCGICKECYIGKYNKIVIKYH